MKILLAGGAGFIGSHVAQSLLVKGVVSELIIYDNFSSGTIGHLNAICADPRLKIVDGDIKHLGSLTHAMRDVDLVYHFAANPDIARAVKQPDIDFWEGTYLTQNILESMRINGVPRIIYTSGSGVYGESKNVYTEDYGPCLPISTYGASKLACESLICSYSKMYGMTSRVFRFANVVGPRQTHGVGYDFIRRLSINPAELKILGDGTQTKSYIHVQDVVAAMGLVESGMCSSVAYDVYNVATDDYITVTDIANIACRVLGLNEECVKFSYTGGDRGWKGDVPSVLFSVEKIKNLGWSAMFNSSEAITQSLLSMKKEI